MAMHTFAVVLLLALVFSILLERTYSISSVGPATGLTRGPTFVSLYEQKNQVLTSLRSAGFHRIAAFIELSSILRALPQNATLFAPSDAAIATIMFSPTFSTLLLYHFAARRFSFPDLLVLPQGTRIGTFLPGRSILVTTGPGATRVSIDGVAIVTPDIYQDETLCVHGVSATFDPDRFGMSEALSQALPAPTRNRSPVTPVPAPTWNPEIRGTPGGAAAAEVRPQGASGPAPFVSASPEGIKSGGPSTTPVGLSWPTGTLRQGSTPVPSTRELENQTAPPPGLANVRTRVLLTPSPTATNMNDGVTSQEPFPSASPARTPSIDEAKVGPAAPEPAPSTRHHNRRISAPSFSPAEYDRLDSGPRCERCSNQWQLRGSDFAPGGARVPSAPYDTDLVSQGPAPALGPDLAPRPHGPSIHHRSRLHAPSTSPVSAGGDVPTPSPGHAARGDNSHDYDLAGVSPFSAPSPQSGTLSSPATLPRPGPSYSPSTKSSPSPSPYNYAVAYVVETTRDSSSASTVNAAAMPSSPTTESPRLAGGSQAPSPSSPSGHYFTSPSPALADATESMRGSTPHAHSLRYFSPTAPPILAPSTRRQLSPLSSPSAWIGSPPPSNAAAEAPSPHPVA